MNAATLDRPNRPAGAHHWKRISREAPINARELEDDKQADLVVVGGGYTGLSAATEAARCGLRVTLLEADAVGLASSGRNQGLVAVAYAHASPSQVEAKFGKVHGGRLNHLVAGAGERIFGIIRDHAIDCDGVQAGWIQPAHSERSLGQARINHSEWEALGARVEWLDRQDVIDQLGTSTFVGGWAVKSGGHVNPYALTCGLARVALKAGVDLHERSRVTSLTADGKLWRVATRRGSVTAARVLLATDSSTTPLLPDLEKVVIPVRCFQVATAPIPAELRQQIMPLNRGYSDMRNYIRASHYDGEYRLTAGGGFAIKVDRVGRSFDDARRYLLNMFPQLKQLKHLEMESYWEGDVGIVPDWLPRIMQIAPGVTLAGLYSGRGIAIGTSFGAEIGRWLGGAITEADLPIPVTGQRNIAWHGLVAATAPAFFPFNRALDIVS